MKGLNKILLIDDSASTNLKNKAIIEELALPVEICSYTNAKDALAYLKGEKNNDVIPKPELIFLDLNMPEIDGFTFLKEYGSLAPEITNNFETVIVIVSDHLQFENFKRSKNFRMSGVLDHIRKPMDKRRCTWNTK